MEKIGKIAVIGDSESATAFLAIGAAVHKVDDEVKAAEVLRELSKSDEYAVILVTENYAAKMEGLMQKLKQQAFPVVLSIPCSTGSNGFGMAGVKKDVEKAVGVDILFN
ncbi:MAG: V-type ATP synthase subunit F [Clostridiales bacterium]|nr:V-type ATP synthase subunit F [Clostridiales bacterium]